METSEKTKSIFKEQLWQDLCGVHGRALKYLRNIAEDFKTLNIGPITTDDLIQIFNQDLSGIKNRYYKGIDSEIKQIKNPLLRENITSGVDETFVQFETNSANNVSRFIDCRFAFSQSFDELSVANYSIEKGEISFTEADAEKLKALCTIEISNPVQEEYCNLMKQGLEILSRLKEIHVKNQMGPLFSYPGEIGLYDEGREDIILAAPHFVESITK